MTDFSSALDRLKYALRVSKDHEVASFLGLSKTAFAERKRRSIFPVKELLLLIFKCPDLGLDFDYVMLGSPSQEFETIATQAAATFPTSLEERMAGQFTQLSPESRQMLLDMAFRLLELEMSLESPQKTESSPATPRTSSHDPVGS